MKNISKHKIGEIMKEIALVSSALPNSEAWYIIAFIFLLIFFLGIYALKIGKNIKISSKIINIETSDKESVSE